MSKIFISYSSHDNAKALALAQWLEQNGWADYFLDIDPKPIRGLLPGERWQAALKTAADRCEVVVFLISPAWRDSRWCLAEFLQAKQLGKPVFGLLIEPTPIDSLPKEMTTEWQLCDLVKGEEQQLFHVVQDQIVPPTDVSLSGAGLGKLKQGLHKTGLNPSYFPWPPPHDPDRRPYRGLKALEAEDAAVFFGRAAPLIRALDTLRRMVESGEQLLVILGASGAGKSSFLRAGLWPRLKRDDRQFLPLPVVRPERAAITGQSGLAESLEGIFREQKAPKTRADIRARLAKPDGFIDLLTEVQANAQRRLGPGAAAPTILLGLDQAEELFNKEGGEEAGQLLELLGQLLTLGPHDQPGVSKARPRVIILAAIRSDSYEQLQTASALTGIRQTPFNLPPLAPGEYKMVIEGPATRSTAAGHKLTIEPALTEQLLKEAEGADALPLLAFILERLLIDYGSDGDLLLREYEALRGLQGSIEAAVNEAWNDPTHEPVIPADEATRRALLNQAFPALVTLDHEADKPKRCVATWSSLPPDTHPLLERLVAARLLLKDMRKQVSGREAVVVELAHEALIRHWPDLKSWVDMNREDLFVFRRTEIEADEWQRQGYDLKYLWHVDRLKQLQEIVAKRGEKSVKESVRLFIAPQDKLCERLQDASLSHQDRYGIGQHLEKLGDRRPGVSLTRGGLPDIEWIDIPGGQIPYVSETNVLSGFLRRFGRQQNNTSFLYVERFRVSKYPVTNAQFESFISAEDGFQNWEWWRDMEQSDEAEPSSREVNSPRVNVSWYQAVAFCRWLSHRTNSMIHLPTEWEWQQAATGGDPHREYPWKGGWDASRCNSPKSGLGRAIAVGMYPSGATQHGVFDMAGNVWEWCLNDNDEMPTGPKTVRINRAGMRVIRGGSFGEIPESLRALDRKLWDANSEDYDIGFRLAQDME